MHSPAKDIEMETFEPVLPIPGINGSYRNAVLPKKGTMYFFSGSLSKGINIKSINKQFEVCHIHNKAFPGAKSTHLNYYVLLTLG